MRNNLKITEKSAIRAKNDSIFTLIKISSKNINILKNLAQAYEAEFSRLTNKMPDKTGKFNLDIFPASPYVGYLLYYKKLPVGFCIADVRNKIKDVSEFYIVPIMRKNKLGYKLACMLFDKHPGQWQVRQITGADHAINFWRYVIKKYTDNHYKEAVVNDNYWGKVTRQRFLAHSSKVKK